MANEFWVKVDKDTVILDGNYIVILRDGEIDVMTFSNLTNGWTKLVENDGYYSTNRHAKGDVIYFAGIPDLPTPEIKCCPFCGSWSVLSSSLPSYRVFCEDCGCSGPEGDSELESIELWNERCE